MSFQAKYFKSKEFDCPCCGANKMNHDFIEKLQRCRTVARVRFDINSGFRCKKHNADPKVGGKKNSEHLIGMAVDIAVPNSRIRFLILNAAIHTGFRRIGICKNFIHLGNSLEHPQEVAWLY